MSDDRTYTTAEVAHQLRVTQQAVTGWCRTGQLPATRAGRGWRIAEKDLAAFIRRGVPRPTASQLLAA